MPYATANGIRIYYETEGNGEPLVLITGYSSDSSHWFTVREELGRHFQLVMLDNRGSGRTDPPQGPFSIEDMADDVIGLCDVLQIKKPHILGHSMGGAIAQSIAFRYSDKVGKVILSQTFAKFRELGRAVIRASLHLGRHQVPTRDQIEIVFPWLFSEDFYQDPRRVEMHIERKLNYPYRATLEALQKQFAAICDFDSSSWYHKITKQTLVLGGEQDLLCPVGESVLMAKGIPGAKIHIFPLMGHEVSVEIPEQHNRVVRDFLA
jgi:3-oxoadipate enol-lactonase